MTYKSSSSAETKEIAARIARSAVESARRGQQFARLTARHALIFALEGELGSGKTTFAKGFLKALGVRKRVVSPTFILMRRSPLRHKVFKNVFHVDAYRIKSMKELKPLHFKEILDNPENIVLIEWADRIKKILPKSALWIHFLYGEKEKERAIKIR